MPSFREAAVSPGASGPFPGAWAADALDAERVLPLAAALGADSWLELPSGEAWYGVGCAATLVSDASPFALVDQAESVLGTLRQVAGSADATPAWLGGFAFDPARTWPDFPAGRLVLPALTLHVREGRARSLAIGTEDEAKTRLAHALASSGKRSEPHRARVLTLEPEVSTERWAEGVRGALRAIDAGGIRKAVLARTLRARLSAPLDALAFASRLRALFPDCARYGFRSGDAWFVGATPELLFEREGTQLTTMALAGTARRDADPDRDRTLGDALLADPKERNEHALVVEAIESALGPLSSELKLDGPHLRRLRNVQHLETTVNATLARATGTRALLEQLHPTPAVCGTPRDGARTLLRDLEPFSRGWYAGPVGFVSQGRSTFAVALRCLLARHDAATLFVGAGLVGGTDPDREWRETEAKAQAMLRALEPEAP
ncbi:MAG: isochorismate synthase [Deltaproteobacteria bacterium]|nr:isochorismate synthase [Deltaproteobacteria bacterium]